MNTTDFNSFIKKQLELCEGTLIKKAGEYATAEDRLHNFNEAARIRSQDPIQAWDGMQMKHEVSINDIIKQMIEHPTYCPPEDLVTEKLTDKLNYLMILGALIQERRSKSLTC